MITLGRVKKREIKKKPKYQVYMVDSYQSTRERVSGAGLAPPDLNRLILFRFSSDKSRPLHVKYIITNKIDYAFKNLKTAEICSIGVSSIVWIYCYESSCRTICNIDFLKNVRIIQFEYRYFFLISKCKSYFLLVCQLKIGNSSKQRSEK